MISPHHTTTRIIAQREREANIIKKFLMAFVTASVVTFLTACLALTIFTLTAPSAHAATGDIYDCSPGVVSWNAGSLWQNISGEGLTGEAYDAGRYMRCGGSGDCTLDDDTGDGYITVRNVGLATLAAFCPYPGQILSESTAGWIYGFYANGTTCTSATEGNTLDFDAIADHYIVAGDDPPLTSGIWNTSNKGYSSTDICGGVEKNNPPWDTYLRVSTDAQYIEDPRENPVVTILEPDELETVAQDTINALGADAFSFIVKSNVSSDTYPGESPEWEVEVYIDAVPPVTLSCRMISSYSGTVDGTADYGTQTNHKVNGDPYPCSHFSQGDYSIRSRVTFPENDPGAWTSWWDFTVGDIDLDPPVTCPEGASFITDFPCWATNAIGYLLVPSDASVQALFDTVIGFGGVWPFSWFADSFGAFIGAIDVDAEDYGEADGGNPLQGDYPNSAWWVEKIQMWFGAWAAPAFAAFIWIGACLAILRAGMRLLNIEYDEVDDDL